MAVHRITVLKLQGLPLSRKDFHARDMKGISSTYKKTTAQLQAIDLQYMMLSVIY
ncbi:hypothetical protein LSTR_LSTR006647 [Laodelphax striatellus]|uniref:Uncharacterized protein n=1 Tax=Laodelphax striatellus TaxID=195883 RepID=A0A482X8C8_LAOST|nr:hypothetical protein LSTR_LSTR006647 [Laodelphax striatellus]